MFFEKSKYKINLLLNTIVDKQLEKINPNQVSMKTEKKVVLSSWLTCIISILSLLILLFIFLYYEIYFLMNIISILIIY